MLGNQAFGGAGGTKAQYAALREKLGLDQPLWSQYWHWLRGAVHGDLGASLFTGQAVRSAIDSRLGVTLSLVLGAVFVSAIVGVMIGILGAIRGGRTAKSLDGLALVGFAIPGFWLGLLLIEFLAVRTTFFPATGYVTLGHSVTGWARSLALPVVALGVGGIAL